ncbi:unnamed protein product [Rhizophagus irregularis]|nr:unnamed protein product [Rhizophagus irregularis]
MSNLIVKEIKRLGFLSKEKISLFTYFTLNVEKTAVVASCLNDLDDDEEKRIYLKSLIFLPDQPDAGVRKKITDVFSDGLPYIEPELLLRTSGVNWESAIISLPFWAGTGKSQNANEFHQTAITCLSAQEDGKLLTKIKEAWLMKDKDDGLKLDSMFYRTLTSFADLAFSGTFMISVCTSTITGLIDGVSVEEARPIARAILTRRLLNRYKPIPKTDKTPDEFVGKMSQRLGDLILRDWEFADYGEQRALLNPITSLQAKLWQSFEKFFTSFRCIKSAVIEENESTSISEVHAGARLNGDIQFKNHNLQLEVAKHHTDTRSKTLIASEWNVDCYNSTVDIRKFKHCIINPVSPYGDSFLSLDQLGTESLNEIHQFKLRKKAVSKKEYQEKHEKFASENDFFILFTTANCNIEISKRSGIVDRNAFTNYFGPFAERAYRSAMANPFIYNNKVKNIHTVSLGQIRNMNQISKEQVNAKTKIPMKNFYF